MERVQRVLLTTQPVAFSDEAQKANLGLRAVNNNESDAKWHGIENQFDLPD